VMTATLFSSIPMISPPHPVNCPPSYKAIMGELSPRPL